MKRTALMAAACIVAVTLLTGCPSKDKEKDEQTRKESLLAMSEDKLWKEATKEKDAVALDAYLEAYPEGKHSKEAVKMLMDKWDEKVRKMSPEEMKGLVAVIDTNMETNGEGIIKFKFYPEAAPNHVRNFIKLAESRFYDGTIFHRVVPGFVIQGGDPLGTGSGGPGYNVDAEFNEQKHLTGTVAMARSMDPNSAGSQFYICLKAQPMLDNKYTVFGQVVEGMEVVEAIGKTKTGAADRPVKEIAMERVYIEGL